MGQTALLWTIRNSLQNQVTLFKQWQREGSREAAPILPGGVLRWPRGQVRPGGEVTPGEPGDDRPRPHLVLSFHSFQRALRRSFVFPLPILSSRKPPRCPHLPTPMVPCREPLKKQVPAWVGLCPSLSVWHLEKLMEE